jgi:uracil-DNA glycosylase
MNTEQTDALRARLRRPGHRFTVPGSLPVLFFGDISSARIATIGLNPSDREYSDSDGALLRGPSKRFATLDSLGARDRPSLTDEQCVEALDWMRRYFEPGKPVYSAYFRHLHEFLHGFGASLTDGTATHLDLVQEATSPRWSDLGKFDRTELLRADLPFLAWQIRAFGLDAVICTGRTVSDQVRELLDAAVMQTGALQRVTWWVGSATVDGRTVGVAGWNHPLHRATGLGTDGERHFGALLRQRLGL